MPNRITTLNKLFNPQVIGDYINQKFIDKIRFTPLCRVDYTLQGRPGDTITVPFFNYIGDAEVVAENGEIPIKELTHGTRTATILKIGNGTSITDEAILSGYGDPFGEMAEQVLLSMVNGVEKIVLAEMKKTKAAMTNTMAARVTPADVSKALVKFGEDIDGTKVLLVSPETYEGLRNTNTWLPASEISASALIRGTVGMVHGCQVVVTNRLSAEKKGFIVKPGALSLLLKRDILVETDRDILTNKTYLTANKHFGCYIYDDNKIIMLNETVA